MSETRRVFLAKHVVYEGLLGLFVFALADGAFRRTNDFVINYLSDTMPTLDPNLWQRFMAEAPRGTFAAMSVGLGVLLGILGPRAKFSLAELWIAQLVATLAGLAAYWYVVSADLSSIYVISGSGGGKPHLFYTH